MHEGIDLQEDSLVDRGLVLCQKIVRIIIKRFKLSDSLFDDLLGQAQVGLVESLRRYDPKLNDSFEGYAAARIRGSCIDYLRRCSGLPPYAYKMIKAFDAYENARAQDPTDNPFSTLATGVLTFQLATGELSFEKLDLFSVSESTEEKILKNDFLKAILQASKKLTVTEQEFLKSCYFEDQTFQEFATKKRKTKGYISRLNKQVIQKLKNLLYEMGYFA
jgi:RNA polymerase sigma factor FliA